MKLHVIFCALFLLAVSSCQHSNTISEEHKAVSDNLVWTKDKPIEFKVRIRENSHPYQMYFAFRYADGFQHNRMMARITEITPSGDKSMKDIDFAVRDAKGEYIGDKGYDIIDLEYLMEDRKTFPEHGEYTYIVEQTVPGVEALAYVMEVGLIVRDGKAK